MLTVDHVTFSYGKIPAIRDVSLTVKERETVCLLGANGAGKTTLANLISGLLKPASGKILFSDRSINELPAHKIAKIGIALVPEGRHLFSQQSVRVNLELGGSCRRGNTKKEINKDLEMVFRIFPKLRERQRQLAGTLSGGEQQMLAIGRALMARPNLLILDEPSTGLSPLIVQELAQAFTELKNQGLSILLIEQNAYLALSLSERGYAMEVGSIVLAADTEHLRENPLVKQIYLGTSTEDLREKQGLVQSSQSELPVWLRVP